MGWSWDPSLYEGSAGHYAVGRMAYPTALADVLRDELGLDGSGRLLDVGCGPGSLTRLLAPLVASAVGVDADAGMIAEARRSGVAGVEWRHLRAEELPADLGTFRLVTFAQSFHWMDQPRVARAVRPMIEPGGAWVHVAATTDRGVEGDDPLPHPRPPWDQVDELVVGYLGPVRRAGQGVLPSGTRGGEEDVLREAGFHGPQRLEVVRGDVVKRSTDELVSAVHSLSSAAPHLFGPRIQEFDDDLRALLRSASPSGTFAERVRDVAVVIWRP
ncbi:bifunctional 2-polyprenyl-6-hydroxyphenol methylase/3-demethylubiquinol 3-O-methyltransferase UbiG [Cellulomonas sp. Leaf334]|uniref:class I SAM-dependent methyltransferase n=1 Tax=Cellulomonas sp. Leaf334 TaxID=1736339 RepID=UPI0006F83076|nr:class I SAM-dependent methyltransferase [Cellulomonas sp. Leaf334]KQR16074.1 methyltransferase [Cellulomonas sp. Leaf334]